MLSQDWNPKLGFIPFFSLPPFKTCPGTNQFCEWFCYGVRGRFTWPLAQKSLVRNWDASLKSNFSQVMTDEIRQRKCRVFRIHEVGDFYSLEYIEKWKQIITNLPNVQFYAYTRSWRVDELAPALELLLDMPNLALLASIDFTCLDNPHNGWRTISVEGNGIPCPHDLKRVKHCTQCRLCWETDNNIKLRVRWRCKNDPRKFNLSPSLL